MSKASCPNCGSERYSFRKVSKGIEWSCKDCGFQKMNRNAEQHLKENPISGRLHSEIDRIEERFEKQRRRV